MLYASGSIEKQPTFNAKFAATLLDPHFARGTGLGRVLFAEGAAGRQPPIVAPLTVPAPPPVLTKEQLEDAAEAYSNIVNSAPPPPLSPEAGRAALEQAVLERLAAPEPAEGPAAVAAQHAAEAREANARARLGSGKGALVEGISIEEEVSVPQQAPEMTLTEMQTTGSDVVEEELAEQQSDGSSRTGQQAALKIATGGRDTVPRQEASAAEEETSDTKEVAPAAEGEAGGDTKEV
eukprot:gene29843-37228_t